MENRHAEILEELGYTPAKTKKTQPQNVEVVQGRDCFQTPNYAVDLLVPFIPEHVTKIWECASGEGKIYRALEKKYYVYGTDIRGGDFVNRELNFLLDEFPLGLVDERWAIITNPPFSLKRKFYNKCREYGVPFALLIPADYSGWIIEACWHDGAEKIIPTRRIDYITPTGLSGDTGHSADFHSMWLTWGFGLGRTETYVELTNEEKKGNI